MATKKILVGNEYEKAFNSVCDLIGGGCLNGLNYSVSNGVISDGTYDYELSAFAGEEAEKVKHGFTANGATWFKALRGEAFENNNAIWTSFIETVKNEYHKRYSVVEYKQQERSKKEKEQALDTARRIAEDFAEIFLPHNLGGVELKKVGGDKSTEDIYGISMRIEVSGGTGETTPILGKVYFTKAGRNLRPLSARVAKSIDDNMAVIVPDEDDGRPADRDEGVIDVALNALDGLVSNQQANFADYLCYNSEDDKKQIDAMLDKLSHDAIELECQRADVLYITHIKAGAFMYDVYVGGNPIIRMTLGINDALSISCIACGSEQVLVDRNEIFYEIEGVKKTVGLFPSQENFGLDSETIEEILQYSEFKNHFIKISCPSNPRNRGCTRIKCRNQVFDCDKTEAVDYKCKDCPYPECVYTSATGEMFFTPNLTFAYDRLDLVDPATGVETKHCAVCGRAFTSDSLKKNKRCPLCSQLLKVDSDPKASKLYKQYKSMLSLTTRLFALFNKKYCVEDDELIIFVVGQKTFVFNKLNVKQVGFIKKPRRLN